MANENFYMEVRYRGKSAVLLVTSEGQWSLRMEEPGFDFEKHAGRRGTFKMPWSSQTQYEFYREGSDEAGFKMSGVVFPPQIIMEPRFLDNQFHIGDAWAKALGYSSPSAATMANRGHWYALATGPLMSWIKQYCEERTKELKSLALSLGLNVAAIFDPTGGLSLAAAIEASTRGDYLGCALNLVAVIPLIGKAAQAARNTEIAARIEKLISEISVLTKWLKDSKAILARTQGATIRGLEGFVKGSAAIGKTVTQAAAIKLLKNNNWIHNIAPADIERLGMLPAELKALQGLAKQGFYFVVRACNPERVKWLEWAAKAGVRTMSKPLWIKAKSLREGGYLAGLVGYKMDAQTAKYLIKVTNPGQGFNPGWLARGGGKMTGLYKLSAGGIHPFKIADSAKMVDHYLVETDGFLILCDSKGAAYVSDFDVAIIQKRLGSGSYGPPGMNVGPKGIPYTGGDNARLRPFWNKQFGNVHYPPGYEVIQHGEFTGTAGNFKSVIPKHGERPFEPSMDTRGTVWGPGSTWDSEQLIVVANAEHLKGGVGWANGWGDLVNFHNANPMGEFRIDP